MSSKRKWLTCFVAHRLELYLSPAWEKAPRPLRRMLERLEIEHLRHGGFNNGELFVSFNQFVDCGISRRSIKPVQMLGVALGLLDVKQPDVWSGDIRPPNAYRLTYLPAKGKSAPSDEWKLMTEVRVDQMLQQFRLDEKVAEKATGKEAA